MKFAPLVSVVIPAFNASEWISETVESVLNQDYESFEILVIDDGSIDNTKNVIASFGNKVRYFYKDNGGQSSARNLGISMACGKYIAFLDSDDLWEKEKLSRQVYLLENGDFKWVYSDGVAFDSLSKEVLWRFNDISRQYEGDILLSLFNSCFIPMPSVVVKREVFSEVGYFNEGQEFRNREDWEMWIRIAEVYPIALVPEILVRYRVHENSVTGKESLLERMNGNILVVKQAALRNPVKLGGYESEVLFNLYFSNAFALLLCGEKSVGRELLGSAIRLKRLSLVSYTAWVLAPIIPGIYYVWKKLNY